MDLEGMAALGRLLDELTPTEESVKARDAREEEARVAAEAKEKESKERFEQIIQKLSFSKDDVIALREYLDSKNWINRELTLADKALLLFMGSEIVNNGKLMEMPIFGGMFKGKVSSHYEHLMFLTNVIVPSDEAKMKNNFHVHCFEEFIGNALNMLYQFHESPYHGLTWEEFEEQPVNVPFDRDKANVFPNELQPIPTTEPPL